MSLNFRERLVVALLHADLYAAFLLGDAGTRSLRELYNAALDTADEFAKTACVRWGHQWEQTNGAAGEKECTRCGSVTSTAQREAEERTSGAKGRRK